ncbi:unnamed protein product [Urochloa decumbens]|uniref:Uncharacterized protein n=1 Tax=Urochloa decumbens TaxID=240449 RepID=A0ABC9CW20_9POAL
MVKKKIVIQVTMPNAKSRADAMALAAKASGVSSVGITGDQKDRLEVVGEGIDVVCLVNLLRDKKPCLVKCLRKPQFCRADILLVEDVKDKKKEEEEKKKKKEEEEKKKKQKEAEEAAKLCITCPPGTCRCAGYYAPAPMLLCEPEQPAGACHIM